MRIISDMGRAPHRQTVDMIRSAFIREAAKTRLPIAGTPTLSEALQADLPIYLGLSESARHTKAHALARLYISPDLWVAEDVVQLSMGKALSKKTRFELRYTIVIRVKTAHVELPHFFQMEVIDGAPRISVPQAKFEAFYEWQHDMQLEAFEERHRATGSMNDKELNQPLGDDKAVGSRAPRDVCPRDIGILALYQVGGWTLERVGRRFPRNGKPMSKQRVSAIVKRVAKRIDLTPRAQLRRGRLPKTRA